MAPEGPPRDTRIRRFLLYQQEVLRITAAETGGTAGMKKLLEILVCFVHPLAVVLAWINLVGRTDLNGGQKLAWGVFLIVPIVPFIYIFTGGDLW